MSVALGLSLGTESCVIAVSSVPGRFDVVADDMGERATPFYVSYSNEEVLVGLAAKNAAVRKPKNTVHAVLALLSAADSSAVQSLKLTCDVDDDEEAGSGVVLSSVADCGDDGTDIARSPNDVLLEYFGRLSVLLTNAAGNSSIGSVVVAVPRGTNTGKVLDAIHRSALVNLSATVRVVYDDTCIAATLRPEALSADAVPQLPAVPVEHVLVIDWGANTLQVSLLALHATCIESLRSASSVGKVAGRQLDKALCNAIADAFQRKTRADPREEPRSMRKLALSVEKAKWALSVSQNANIELEAFCNGADLNEPFSRMKLEMAFDTLGAGAVLERLVSEVVGETAVHSVVLAGGMCRIPRVQTLVRNTTQKICPSAKLVDRGAPDELAAMGACMAAQSLPHGKGSWLDGESQSTAVIAYTLVVSGSEGEVPLIDPSEPLPATRCVKFATPLSGATAVCFGAKVGDAATSWITKVEFPSGSHGFDVTVDTAGTLVVRLIDAKGKRKGGLPLVAVDAAAP